MLEPDYESLVADHDNIDSLAAQLATFSRSDEKSARCLGDTLSRLASLVSDHLAQEESSLYTALLHAQRGVGDPRANELETAFEALKRDWASYLADWPLDRIEADRETFHRDTAEMMDRLRDRVRLETSILYGEALRLGMIRLRRSR